MEITMIDETAEPLFVMSNIELEINLVWDTDTVAAHHTETNLDGRLASIEGM